MFVNMVPIQCIQTWSFIMNINMDVKRGDIGIILWDQKIVIVPAHN
jgi:hypothetical protein